MKCLACRNTDFVKGTEKTVFNRNMTIYRCNFCGLIFTHPLPTKSELQEYYSSGEAQSHSGFDLNYLIEKHEEFLKKPPSSYLFLKRFFLNLTNHLPQGKSCLEIGCNLGVFIELVQPVSHLNFYAIEFNSQAVDFVRGRGKFLIDNQSIENEPFPGVNFDCVIMFDVLEHVPEPIQFIEAIKKRLNLQGLILVAVPNASAWSHRLLRILKKWRNKDIFPTVEPPFHLYGYNRNNLELVFAQCGFKMIDIEYYLMEHFDVQDNQTEDVPFNLNRATGNLLSNISTVTRDDKIIAAFRKTESR